MPEPYFLFWGALVVVAQHSGLAAGHPAEGRAVLSAQEDAELNELFANPGPTPPGDVVWRQPLVAVGGGGGNGNPKGNDERGPLVQWTTSDGKRFVPAERTMNPLPPGLYEIGISTSHGIYFEAVPVRTEGLIRLPDTNSERVVDEIQMFWNRGERYAEYGLPHKRGIMLWGPPGSGKSCTIQLVMRDVIVRGGIGIVFNHPGLFAAGVRALRQIQPDTPVVALMEDIDSLVRQYQESEILNLLDGAERVERIVFLASTNYPELLGPRIMNRPSRFDRRFKVGHPNAASREVYLKHLIGERRLDEVDIDRWVQDTDGMSLAHLKELFVACVILQNEYEESIETLRSMREHLDSAREGRTAGLAFQLGR